MPDACVFCENKFIPQPNLTKEQLMEDLRYLRTPDQRDIMDKWLKDRPPKVQEMARKFPNYQLYRIKEGAQYRHTCSGCVVAVYSFLENKKKDIVEIRIKVLQSPIGTAGIVAEVDPHWLEPICIDDLEE